MSNKKIIILIILSIIIVPFYWNSIRPSLIKKKCATVNVEGVSNREKEEIKVLFDNEKCDELDVADRIIGNILDKGKNQKIKLCNEYLEKLNAPNKDYEKSATDKEYKQCLRKNGL